MRLVIVESPNKVKKIGGFLGQGYKVSASFGHIRDLPQRELGIDVDGNSVTPNYEITKAKQVRALKALAKDADEILIATDPDREGEAIGWHLMQVLGKRKTYRRVVFNAITASAVREAVANPTDLDIGLVDAQQARRCLDRVVGWLVSPTLKAGVGQGARSAGRVQSVAVRIVAEREKAIRNFVPKDYGDLVAKLEADSPPLFDAKLVNWKGEAVGTKLSVEEVTGISRLCTGVWTVDKVEKKSAKKNAPPPFTTSTVQQAASVKLKMAPDKTMSGLQALFEGGHITYHRTDSVGLSPEGIEGARQVISDKFGTQYLPEKPNMHATGVANAQEAHEAIRPTHPESGDEPDSIGQELRPLYQLIWQRYIACQMIPAIDNVTTVDVLVSGADGAFFQAKGKIPVEAGWKIVTADATEEPDDSKEADGEKPLPDLKQGQVLECVDLTVSSKKTKPPSRFTQASLIKHLEKEGVGRPSTYAAIMKTIVDRGYVTEQKRKLHAADIGMTITSWLQEHYSHNFIEVSFTSDIEKSLDEIAAGKRSWQTFLSEVIENLLNLSMKAGLKGNPFSDETVQHVAVEGVTCPLCGGGMREIQGKKGVFYGCLNYPKCKGTLNPNAKDGPPCPLCGSKTIERTGKKGKFYGCSRYPDCKGIVKEATAQQSAKPKKKGPPCPECGSETHQRKGKHGNFFGCSRYPDCKGIVKG